MGVEQQFKRVAVLMGGDSSERDVSLRSGAAIARGLIEAGFDAVAIDVPAQSIALADDVEAVFLAFHGAFGEDGGAQSILDQRGIPYTGTGAAASRIAFDKVATKQVLERAGVVTPPYEVLTAGAARTLSLPVVAKPVREGSSIGVHRVFDDADWDTALVDASQYGGDVLVESFIPGRELTVGVLDGMPLPVVEITAPDGWYGYEAKYTKGATDYIVPAPLTDVLTSRIQSLAATAFHAVGCRGAARVDFRLTAAGDAYALEINTIPGFTETSLLPMAAAAAGISFSQLCARIMALATCDQPEPEVCDALA